ncbi:hypothetical protein BDB00DRAFT_873005 [Zychaea mexicana]|uniref:uncharacterized protein n=1 Tax=Zychaea mexicana TaxID=64656 RepID=UPI0022FDDFF7|nr:uncharacterized protein BDB00DRAFT_873005 [Zychaea mexicana]KAI9492784.1 hypothetical protein BDB00DRAFT_873005 [Zychaea mexicana]
MPLEQRQLTCTNLGLIDINGRTRKTNGPLWSENLAEAWGAPLKSFAQAGALTCARPDEVSDLSQQFMAAKPAISSASSGDNAVKNIHAIFIGNTDVADGADSTVQIEPLLRCIKQHVLEIQRLDGNGRILLLGLPPLEFSPFYLHNKHQQVVKQRTMDFNGAIEDAAQDWHDELKMDVEYVDIYTVFNGVLGDPQEYNMENVEDAYWEKCQGTCLDPVDEYLWWDSIHMTGAGHQAISKEILAHIPALDTSRPPPPPPPSLPDPSSSSTTQEDIAGAAEAPFYTQVHIASWFLLFFVCMFILFLLRPARIAGMFKSCARTRKFSKPAMSGYSIV